MHRRSVEEERCILKEEQRVEWAKAVDRVVQRQQIYDMLYRFAGHFPPPQ